MRGHKGGQDCAAAHLVDEIHVIEEDEDCVRVETGDVVCMECGKMLLEQEPDMCAVMKLRDVHPDWRVPRK